MKEILEGVSMALLLMVVLTAAYLLAVFVLAGLDAEEFRRLIESLG
jgi:hypothetical protein